MKKILIYLSTISLLATGGGLLFLKFNPQYANSSEPSNKELWDALINPNTTADNENSDNENSDYENNWPTEVFVSQGFQKWNDNIAFRWLPRTYSNCSAENCKSIEVIAKYGCPNSLYAKVTQLDRDDRNIGYSNDSTSGIRPNQKALLKFRSWEKGLQVWSLDEINCR